MRARCLYQLLWPEVTVPCPWQQEVPNAHNMDVEATDTNPKCSSTLNGLPTVTSCASPPMVAHETTPFKAELKAALKLLSICVGESQSHQACIPENMNWRSFPGVRFRVVDTIHNCVVEPSQIPKYATLSYVWGKNKQLQLLTSNQTKLMSQGAFLKGDVTPSQTILDALGVCQILGLRYLWVDALCIIQDDSRDRTMQILRMRRVYSGSSLTIVAACGNDSTDGIRLPSHNYTAHDDGDDDACTQSAGKIYKGSVWNSRGWTLQEAALSHRVLLFTPAGLYFSCQKFAHCAIQAHRTCAARFDGQLLDLGPEMTFLRNSNPLNNKHSQLKAFFEASSAYSGREISDPADLINAFKGILQCFEPRMDGLKNTFHHGLPLSAFDQAFCWQTRWHCPRRRRLEHPSWSWLGWNCPVFWSRQHLSTSLKDRSAILLWPRLSEWQWDLEKWELDTQAERGFVSHPNLAHQYRDRIACADEKQIFREDKLATFCWGLPVACELNYRNNRLWIIGTVAKLSVTLTEKCAYTPSAQFNNRRYKVAVPETGHELGNFLLNEDWRESQPVLLRFMLVDGIMRSKCLEKAYGDAELVGTHLLCYQHDRNTLGRPDGDNSLMSVESGSRVQILECQVTENLWRHAGAVRVSLFLL